MTFDDEIRATMRAHDDEAPRGFSVPSRRRRAWLPAVAAAAVVLGAVGLSVALGRNDEPAPATGATSLTCPVHVRRGTSVPDAPDDIAPRDRLVPDRTPTRVLVCGYTRKNGTGPVTRSSHELAGNLAAVRDSLAFLPGGKGAMCAAIGLPTDEDQYLIGLTYRNGTVWVAQPNTFCKGASNGSFDTPVNVAAFASASVAAGHWVSNPVQAKKNVKCDVTGRGRLGQDSQLVPGTPTGLAICTSSGSHATMTRVRTDFSPLLARLRSIPTRTSDNGCTGSSQNSSYTLLFSYSRGPGVSIGFRVGCHPELDNQGVAADDTDSSVLAEVKRLIAAN